MRSDDRTDDIAAAIEVLGWTDVRDDYYLHGGWYGRPLRAMSGDSPEMKAKGISMLPRFGEYIEDAYLLVDTIVEQGWEFQCGTVPRRRGQYWAKFYHADQGIGLAHPQFYCEPQHDCDGYTQEYAIRAAALRAVREHRKKEQEQDATA